MTSSRLRVAHLIPYLGRAQGGPVFGLASYAKTLAEAGCGVEIFTVRQPADGELIAIPPAVQVKAFDHGGWGSFRRCPDLARALSEAGCDLVHSHGLWTDVHRVAAIQAKERCLPHLLAPCGMLAPGALRHHWWKKLPARFWFQARALREAACLHAKSKLECEHIRRFGLTNPVAVIPNPVAPLPAVDRMSDEDFRRTHQIPVGRRIVLYLGRLHRVKGVARLVEAWARIQRGKAGSRERGAGSRERGAGSRERETVGGEDWVLVLAGPDEGGYREELESLIDQMGCRSTVVFTGALNEKQKWGALATAGLFGMPSDFENFGNAIVEAMSCAVPVISTTGTPWEELNTTGAGWWVSPSVEGLTDALRKALAMSDAERRGMGERAFRLAERFGPGQIGKDLIEVYQWLLGAGPRPACVVQ
jgi:glycosyltransferase involved in cell wall biosynthesis